jgi:hypothetical protein
MISDAVYAEIKLGSHPEPPTYVGSISFNSRRLNLNILSFAWGCFSKK